MGQIEVILQPYLRNLNPEENIKLGVISEQNKLFVNKDLDYHHSQPALDIIMKVRHEKRVSHALLARRIKRSQPTVKRLLSGTSIQTYLVWELSVALGHNFFTDLAQQLDAVTEGKLEAQTTELDSLKQEYARLKEERDYLRKAMDLLSRG